VRAFDVLYFRNERAEQLWYRYTVTGSYMNFNHQMLTLINMTRTVWCYIACKWRQVSLSFRV